MFEVADVASGDAGALRTRDACYQAVGHIAVAESTLCKRAAFGSALSCFAVQVQHLVSETTKHHAKSTFQPGFSLPGRHALNAERNFMNADDGEPKMGWVLTIDPIGHARVCFPPHQRREYVGVENDHGSNSTGRVDQERRDSRRERSNPSQSLREILYLLISRASQLPKPSPGGGPIVSSGALAAASSTLRTSASKLRPCRLARSLRRSFTESGKFRTTNWAILPPLIS